jgi:hypothetical protein
MTVQVATRVEVEAARDRVWSHCLAPEGDAVLRRVLARMSALRGPIPEAPERPWRTRLDDAARMLAALSEKDGTPMDGPKFRAAMRELRGAVPWAGPPVPAHPEDAHGAR